MLKNDIIEELKLRFERITEANGFYNTVKKVEIDFNDMFDNKDLPAISFNALDTRTSQEFYGGNELKVLNISFLFLKRFHKNDGKGYLEKFKMENDIIKAIQTDLQNEVDYSFNDKIVKFDPVDFNYLEGVDNNYNFVGIDGNINIYFIEDLEDL